MREKKHYDTLQQFNDDIQIHIMVCPIWPKHVIIHRMSQEERSVLCEVIVLDSLSKEAYMCM
jgi:hypothetical protein